MRPKAMQKRARVDARMMSASRAIEKPAPYATPSTAAITGRSSACSALTTRWPRRMRLRRDSGVCSEASFILRTSPPAQNAPPAPVRITARTVSSRVIVVSSWSSSTSIVASRAFFDCGRLSVMVATPSSQLYRMVSMSSPGLRSVGSPGFVFGAPAVIVMLRLARTLSRTGRRTPLGPRHDAAMAVAPSACGQTAPNP